MKKRKIKKWYKGILRCDKYSYSALNKLKRRFWKLEFVEALEQTIYVLDLYSVKKTIYKKS